VTTAKINAENEYIKRRYFTYLEDAKGKATSSVDQIAAAIASFEASTNSNASTLNRQSPSRPIFQGKPARLPASPWLLPR
jgi:hypothetical protein